MTAGKDLNLRADPLPLFHEARGPIALHVRARWGRQPRQAAAKAKAEAARIRRSQAADGSWDGAVADTIHGLFALWLLAPERTPSVDRALDWLLETSHPPLKRPCPDGASYDNLFFRTTRRDNRELQQLRNVPFTPGCTGFVKTGAALFFAVQFGRIEDGRVKAAFRSINKTAVARQGKLCCGSCANNIILALAVHPRHRRGRGMAQVVSHLAGSQSPTGNWSGGIPFYPTFWALSHVDLPAAKRQFAAALTRVRRSQNRDGSWGRTQLHLQTFLVLDALRRKGIEVLHP
jgi:hypothetical protein